MSLPQNFLCHITQTNEYSALFVAKTRWLNSPRKMITWSEKDEVELYDSLKLLSRNNVKWALSNNLSTNPLLLDFVTENNLTIHEINTTYKNCNYQKKDKSEAKEVLITNY